MKNLFAALVLLISSSIIFAQTPQIVVTTNSPLITSSFKNQGVYSTTTIYNVNDVVSFLGNQYYSLVGSNLNNTPVTGSSFWGTFNSTSNINANSLTGTVLATNVLNSSLTSVGTLISGTWQANIIASAYLKSCGASGTNHSAGIVPDPGVTAGITRFLREDCTWVTITSGETPGGTTGSIQYNNAGIFGGVNFTGLVKLNGSNPPTQAISGTDFDSPGAAAAAQSAAISSAAASGLQKTNNLSDLNNISTARTNLGLGTAAQSSTSEFDPAGAATTVANSACLLTGCTMTGPIVLPGNPTSSLQASTKQYVDGINPLTVAAEWPFNEGTGTIAHDITGNGHDATFCASTASPTWGNNGIQFLTSLVASQCATTNVTSFGSIAIAYEIFANPTTTGITSPAGPYPTYPALWGVNAALGGVDIIGSNGTLSSSASGAFDPTSFSVGGGAVAAAFISSVNNGFGQRHVLVFVPGNPDAWYLDGSLLTLSTTGNSITAIPTTSFYQFGRGAAGANPYLGTIQYATMTPVGTSWSQAQAIIETNYIQSKLNSRPLTHYLIATNKNPTIVMAGDSLWAGREGTAVWTSMLALNNTYTVVNHGISGEMATDIGNLAESTWLTSVSPTAKTYVPIDGGTNDLASNITATNIWSGYVTSIQKIRKFNAFPICSTIISATGRDTLIAPVNALIRANWKSQGCVALLDNAERPEFAAGGSTNTTFYNADGVHLTGLTACTATTGYGLFCMGASKVINTLDGSSQINPDQTASNAFVETDANSYIIQTPTAAATHQLVDCSWITGMTKTIANGSATNTITISSTSSQVITGSTAVLPNTTAIYTVVLTSPTAGGCSWLRIQ